MRSLLLRCYEIIQLQWSVTIIRGVPINQSINQKYKVVEFVPKMTTSIEKRKEGAKNYSDAFVETGLAPGLRLERAKTALKLFMEARKAAYTEGSGENWVYATKNYGITCCKIGSDRDFYDRLNNDSLMFYFKEGFKYLIEAQVNGMKLVLPKEWHEKVAAQLDWAVDSFTDFVIYSQVEWQWRCSMMSNLLGEIRDSNIVIARIHVKMAREMLKHAVKCSEENQVKESLSILHELYQPVAFAQQYLDRISPDTRPATILEDIRDIEHSQRRYMSRMSSTMKLHNAQTTEKALLNDYEELDMDLAMNVLDQYTDAMLSSRSEVDGQSCLESEAIAAASLGTFHHNVLKTTDRGHQHLLHAIQLADTETHASGITFFHCEWYKNAVALIKKVRDERLCFDVEAAAKKRAPTLEKLKPELDAIQKSMKKFEGKLYK